MHRKQHSNSRISIFLKQASVTEACLFLRIMEQKKLRIAMLEDDSDDRYLTSEVLNDLNFNLQIDFYSSSNDLLAKISTLKPDLILVDYNSTPQNGIEVLRTIKANNDLSSIPLVILSDSKLSKYKAECYCEGANGFVVKPTSLTETKKKIRSFFIYWTEVAES
jgi:CheY-like chemotaxis protein